MLGNEEDFSAALGYDVPGVDEQFSNLATENFKAMIEVVLKDLSVPGGRHDTAQSHQRHA